ncbi:hypothetical protein JMJ35_001454 [Cladonia borealis]|uniref:Uncharacterized protein n=1 Tax=Cladonia borealis TaxID=184061 RepID=A0AA39R7W3_9LECA|nr:hypothetical protein JMJ35_001454 [Cladonia borealis]
MPLVTKVLFLLLFVRVRAQMTSFTNESSFSNISSITSAPYFPYIIPYGQTQELGINLTTTTMTTVLPCSSYLTAQSNYIVSVAGDFNDEGMQEIQFVDPREGVLGTWAASFGRSPECSSFAQVAFNSLFTFTGCGSSNTIISMQWDSGDSFGLPTQIPPGVLRYESPNEVNAACCGNCTLDFSEMRLYYFPDGNSTDCQYNGTSNSTSTFTAGNLGKRMQSLIPDGSTAVVGEHTFTSPSLYLQVVGTASVHDECTTVGPVLTSPIITLAPGELSTWAPFSEDMSWFSSGHALAEIDDEMVREFGAAKPLLIKDLACPTWGLGMSTSADGTSFAAVGPPFLPVIIPPTQAFTLDPAWSALCHGMMIDPLQHGNFIIFDPPTVLTPASNMVRPTPAVAQASPITAPESQPTASAVPVKPASPPTNREAPPAETGDLVVGSRASSTSPAPVEPSPLVSDPDGPTPSASDSVDPRANTPPNMPAAPISTAIQAGDPPINPGPSPLASPDPSSGSNTCGRSSEPQTQDLGAFIYNAIGGSGPQGSGQRSEDTSEAGIITLPASNSQLITTIANHVLSINPSDLAFEGITYSPSGPAMTLSSNLFTLVPDSGSDDKLASDGSNGQASDLQMASTPPVIGGHTLVYSPSGLVIDGQTIQPGSSALTISKTPISLGSSGLLVFGSSSITLPSQSIFVIGSQTFTANPTGFTLDAGSISPDGAVETTDITAISAGGPAVTVDGTVVSLGPSGVLAIGSSTFTLPSPTPAASVNQPLVIAGQTITPSGLALSIVGTIISPGGLAVSINGTIVNLQPSGTLVVGSNSFALPTPSLPTYDIGGLGVQAESSFAVVDGVTVDPGAAGVTVAGSVVSLELGGKTLDVGSGRFAMPTASVNGTAGLQTFHGGQGKERTLSVRNILGTWIFGMVMLW